MLIGIDGNEANIKERVGVNVWAFELLKQFKEIRGKRQEAGRLKFVIYLSKSPIEDMPEESQIFRYRVIGPGRFWTRWRLPLDLYLHKPRPDVFLSLSHYSPKWAPIPRVVSIMDLSFLKFPEAFRPAVIWQLKNWTTESVKKAVHIIAISEFTKQEIIKRYKYPAKRISVVYPGVGGRYLEFENQKPEIRDRIIENIKQKYQLGSYILFVGTRQKKKNLKGLLEAFELVRKDDPEMELVIAGKVWAQFAKDEILPLMEGSHPSIKYIGFVNEKDLPALMAGARVFVLPSLYEGFGIPAVEAATAGTLVAVSNTTGLKEIAEQIGAWQFNPNDIEEMAVLINRAATKMEKDRQEVIKKGMIRAKQFDWDESAKKVLNILINER